MAAIDGQVFSIVKNARITATTTIYLKRWPCGGKDVYVKMKMQKKK